ncbi:PEP-CTERM system histidine kinase PrsK [Altererythrobacter gangjinensis]|uniref:histidine kinase n=2 Tax=Pontixanthobacter gangjinensis TaxID=1028742 RepID=A0A6I4SRJ8_9SPHN|nr:PEP-CTERM system histidine kinase PrsK [Pontixanthobacter gangjinensis]
MLGVFGLYLVAAAGSFLAALWIATRGDKDRPDHKAIIGALAVTSAWCLCVAALGPAAALSSVAEILRDFAWILVVYRLFANDGRHETLKPIRPVVYALGFVECLQLALLFVQLRFAVTAEIDAIVFQLSAMFRVMVAVGALVLLHNLYLGAVQSIRSVLRWTAAALAGLFAFDLNFFTVAYMGGGLPLELTAVRGLVVAVVCLPFAIGSTRSAASIRLSPSRSVAFQTLSLLLIGAYLLLMVGIAQSLSMLGGDVGRLTQVGFTFAATVFALMWLPSHRLRGWVRVTAVKHLFQHRYDYRAEWLRFTRTIGQGDDVNQSLQERAIKAMADITDSPSGLLLLQDDNGSLELASRWLWREIEVPTASIPTGLAKLFEEKNFILDVDDIRNGKDQHGESAMMPSWIQDTPEAWALVPLLHFDRLTGIIVLARPAAPRRLDWEDFDLLRVVGQQLSSYLAEQAGQQALMESARFDEFNRRIAFVMHDIKNLASQMSLLARNAEKHAEKPEFRADMLVTLRNSADKLNGLLARLGRYGTNSSEKREPVDLDQVAKRVLSQYENAHSVSIVRSENSQVLADAEGLEQALVHLMQNAIDASEADSPVYLDVSCDGLRGRIDVVDSGTGMSAEFIRNGLFKPFVSSKNAGFGIGAFEAREMVRAMGGRLDVDSREGLGTRFSISFPLSAVSGFLSDTETHQQAEVA